MRRIVLLTLLLPAVSHGAPPVEANSFATAGDIHRFCQRDLGHPVCTGYIAAVHDTLAMLVAAGVPGLAPYAACVPPQADARVVSRAVEEYLAGRAELLDRGAAGVIAQALHVRFPCRTAATAPGAAAPGSIGPQGD